MHRQTRNRYSVRAWLDRILHARTEQRSVPPAPHPARIGPDPLRNEPPVRAGHPLHLGPEHEILWVSPFRTNGAAVQGPLIGRRPPLFMGFQSHPEATEPQRNQQSIELETVRGWLADGAGAQSITNFAVRLSGPTLVGERAIIVGDRLISDSLHPNHTGATFTSEDRRRFEFTHLDVDREVFIPTLGADDTVMHDEEMALLSSMEQGNYGAYLLRVIPKLATLRHLGIKPSKYFVASGAPWQQAVLQAFGVGTDEIVPYDHTKLHRFRSLIVPDLCTSEFYPNDLTVEFFRDFVARAVRGDDTGRRPKRLYISRLRQARERPHYRVCENEAELVEQMKALGFHILEPEVYSFMEQVRFFAAADLVVGPSGAAMFNTIFCPPRTRILSIEPMSTWAVLHANMFGGWHHDFAMILGGTHPDDPTPQKRWRADIDLIVGQTKAML